MRRALSVAVLSICSVTAGGCGSDSSTDIDASLVTSVSVDRSKYMLAEEPDGAIGVIEARETGADGQPIVVVGKIGGATNPWIEGRAAFMLLDASKTVVADGAECGAGEICMDDCCATDRAACTTLVKFLDEAGKVLAVDARQLLEVSSDELVVVRGKVSKDAEGNFAVLADGVHVRR
jgi:hypothetical protein